MKVSEIRPDPELIEMRRVQPATVSEYKHAMRHGAKFPPLIVDKKTNMIVSGNHRWAAYLAEFGEDHKVDVELRTYKTRADLIKDFAKSNLSHGRQMTGYERRWIISTLLNREHVPPEEIAVLFSRPVKTIMTEGGMELTVIEGNQKSHKPIKRGMEHMIGEEVTAEQYHDHSHKDRGVPAAQLIGQIIRWLENGFMPQDQQTQKSLMALRDALESYLSR